MTASTSAPSDLASPSPRLLALPQYVFSWLDDLKAAARGRGANLIDLGIGNPDQPTPAPIVGALTAAFADPTTHGYPSFRGTPLFLRAAADFMQRRFGVHVDPDREVQCLSGAKEGLAHITMAYADPGTVSLVPDIYYPVHGRATVLMGGDVHWLPLRADHAYLPRLDDIPADVLRRARLLFLNYPHNPTGATASRRFFEDAVAFCRHHAIVLVSDLAYSEITFADDAAPSVLEIPGARDVAIEFHSLSKSFNMAGSRIGFAVGGAELIDVLGAVRTNMGYGTPMAIQAGAAFALDHSATLVPPIAQRYRLRRDLLTEGFRSLGWTVTPPAAAMYLWLPVPRSHTSLSWAEHHIASAGVVVTPGNAFGTGGEGFFRVSLVAEPPVLREAIDRMRRSGAAFE
jgi:LL-diaminopimelate aminotransferase